MRELYAQGDVLIERVADIPITGTPIAPAADGAVVLAEGEVTGHRHVIYDNVQFFRDDGLARDIPGGLYLGHLRVEGPTAEVVHEEHAPIPLSVGYYRVVRQREYLPGAIRPVSD